ncbi:MAG TPA: carboxypeptidase-like regulatory domain-containing protein, partial [Cytophagaceae bacterium]
MFTKSLLINLASIFCLYFLSIYSQSFAQTVSEETPAYTKGSVHGEIKDDQTKEPIPFVTISIIKLPDSTLVTGNISDENGIFEISQVPEGNYIARLNALGFKVLNTSAFTIDKGNRRINLGKIPLAADAKVMEEVVVQGEKGMMQNNIDKKVYNTEKMGVTQGATAVEILGNVPSVNVDVDGNASLRGGGVIILIDGRPSGLSGGSRSAALEQIPASSIERVEVITNPSAKYDPDGTTGIINIILKKNDKLGYNGSASISIGNRDKYNGSLNFNIRKKKLNFFTNYTYRYADYYGYGSSNRRSYLADTTFYLRQKNNSGNINISHLLKTGIDYRLNDRNSVGLSGTLNLRDRTGFEEIDYFTYDRYQAEIGSFRRDNGQKSNGNSFDVNANYIRTYATQGENLTVDFN